MRSRSRRAACVMLAAISGAAVLPAQASTTYEQTYFRASHNWAFRRRYPEADRLFNAFDYGHSRLAELLYTRPNDAASVLDQREFDFITTRLLVHPPGVPLESHALAPEFTRLAPEVDDMFEWAHMLHRQIYDVWADDRIPESQKDARVAEVVRYYRSRGDLALSAMPKSMTLMEGQAYSGAFRERNPKFNGLIWSYHWLQMVLYDAMLSTPPGAPRREAIDTTVAHFRSMHTCGQAGLPASMPLTPGVAPLFAARYPEASAIFDNLHALHDVVSDILASPKIPRSEKRAALLKAAAAYRDSTTSITTRDEWKSMAREMGTAYPGCPSK
jgi:hypothetical protein